MNAHTLISSAVSVALPWQQNGTDLGQLDSATTSHTPKRCLKSTGPTFHATKTLKNYEASHTQASLFSLVDFPASHSVVPGSSEARKTTAISGLKCCELYERPNLVGSLVKMLLASSTWHSTKCILTWKQKATKSNRLLFQLAVLMPRTEETESGLWPTPRAGGGEEGYQTRSARKGHRVAISYLKTRVDYLENYAPKMWPTATQNGNYNKKGISKKSGNGLATAAKLWPTPRASEYKDTGPVGSKSHTHMNDRDYLCAKAKDPSRPSGCLSPMWTEWLMGYPIGWGELEVSEMPSSRKSRQKSSDASSR